ncbi:MAG: PAS domain S-box protein, partial [Chloroflexi bacterium]
AAALASGGPRSQTVWFYLVVVLFAGILLGGRAGLLTGLACSLATLGVWLVDAAGVRLPSVVTDPALDFWLVFITSLVSVTLLQYLATRSIRESLDQANHELAERRLADLRLSESEQKFRSLVERSTDGILLLDEQGCIIEYNQALEKISGIPREQALGMTGWDYQYLLMLPEFKTQANYERVQSAFERVIQTGQVLYAEHEIEGPFRRADGQTRAVAQKIFTIPTERGFRVAAVSRDVTERKKAEEALRQSQAALSESNETLQAIVDGSPVAISMMDLDGNMELWNPASERVFGWAAEEVLGKPNPIIPPERRGEYGVINQQMFQNGKISEFETQRQRKDGTRIDISLSSAVIRDAAGQPRASMAIIADITERKRAERDLVESTRRLYTTINNLRGVVYRCANDLNWTMEYISDGILDLSGYPAEDFIANRTRPFSSIIEPEDRAMVWHEIQHALIRRQPYTLEYRIRTASGEQKWAWERGRGVFEGDQFVALEGFISNITDRKKAEEEAIIEQRRLNSLLHIAQKKTESAAELLDCALEEV